MKVLLRCLAILIATLVCFACPTPNSCLPPKVVNATNITATQATINWTPVAGVSSYQLKLFKQIDSINYQLILTDTVVGTNRDLGNLQPNTAYRVDISSICGPNQISIPHSVMFKTSTIIIVEEIVFTKGENDGNNNCVGKDPLTSQANPTSPISLATGQVMHVKITDNGVILSEFSLIKDYDQSNASWTIATNSDCDTKPPSLDPSRYGDILSANGSILTFTRHGQVFKLIIDPAKTIEFVLPPNSTATVNILTYATTMP